MSAGVFVTVSPKVTSVAPSGSQQFTCTVAGSTNTTCTWAVTEAQGGTITNAGVYTAPATGTTFHVVATSAADPSKSDTASVSLVAPCGGLKGSVGTNISPSGPRLSRSHGVDADAGSICANGTCRGSNEMAYDSVNHIVYSANWGSGLWRLVPRQDERT